MALTNGLRPYVESAEQLDELLGETLDKLRQAVEPAVAQAAPPMTAPPIGQDMCGVSLMASCCRFPQTTNLHLHGVYSDPGVLEQVCCRLVLLDNSAQLHNSAQLPAGARCLACTLVMCASLLLHAAPWLLQCSRTTTSLSMGHRTAAATTFLCDSTQVCACLLVGCAFLQRSISSWLERSGLPRPPSRPGTDLHLPSARRPHARAVLVSSAALVSQ